MGIFNVIGSLQNLESAEAAGDKYPNFSSLAVNGLGSMLASCFGSTFPTTIYIGHPGWKQMGARTGYSILNGIFIALLCFTGLTFILNIIPLEAGMGILLWIGVIIVVQAFGEVPKQHMPAVAIGLFPALAAWGLILIQNTLIAVKTSLYNVYQPLNNVIALNGLISLERGFIFSSMILAAISVFLLDRKFLKATIWALVASLLAYVGIIHSFKLVPAGLLYDFRIYAAPKFAITYVFGTTVFCLSHLFAATKR